MYSVFIADDNTGWLESLCARINQERDFEVVASTGNGKKAIELIESLWPDIIILDIIIPDCDGVNIVNHIRGNLREYKPVIYILSGLATDAIITTLNDLHIDFYSLKPITLEIVIHNLKNILSHKFQNFDGSRRISAPPSESVIEDVLSELGLYPHLMSTKYIYEALLYYLKDSDNYRMLTKVLYPTIAQQNKTTPGAVEKNIRLGISQMGKTNSKLYDEMFPYRSSKKITNSIFLSVTSKYIMRKLNA